MVWNTSTYPEYVLSSLECLRQKVVGEPDEGKPHVRFDVAGDENQDFLSQASSPDPTRLTCCHVPFKGFFPLENLVPFRQLALVATRS